MYEGGIRTPMIVRMPGIVPAGTESNLVWYFPDVMPTLASIAKAEAPKDIDGIDIWEELQGNSYEAPERILYWEFHEGGFFQAARWKDWKGVRTGIQGPLELYNLSTDPAEANNIAEQHPDKVTQIETFLSQARTESIYWKAK